MFSGLSALILKLTGWKVVGGPPRGINKYVLVPMPHTSNFDFPIGLLVRSKLKIPANFVGKSSLFKPPHGWIFRLLGGYPIDRSKRHNAVEQIVQLFQSNDTFVLAITPEGTRKKVDQLKTGFYYIALNAGVPLVRVAIDFGTKTVSFSDPYYPTGDYEKDLPEFLSFYKGARGYNNDLAFELPNY